jgi:hypothetical protein
MEYLEKQGTKQGYTLTLDMTDKKSSKSTFPLPLASAARI